MATKRKPVPGHKRERVTFSVSVACECGWRSGNWAGPGASKNAHAEWRGHVDECLRTQAKLSKAIAGNQDSREARAAEKAANVTGHLEEES